MLNFEDSLEYAGYFGYGVELDVYAKSYTAIINGKETLIQSLSSIFVMGSYISPSQKTNIFIDGGKIS